MAGGGIARLSSDKALGRIAILIDASHAPRRSAGIARALDWCDQLEARGLDPAQQARLDYFRANAWDRRTPKRRTQRASAARWEQPALEKEVFYLRRARTSQGFERLHKIERCQVLTNLGNQLSQAGRFVEALEEWRGALAIVPDFWMARGNRPRS